MSNLLQHINMTTLSLFDSLQPFINSSITSFSDAHSDDVLHKGRKSHLEKRMGVVQGNFCWVLFAFVNFNMVLLFTEVPQRRDLFKESSEINFNSKIFDHYQPYSHIKQYIYLI